MLSHSSTVAGYVEMIDNTFMSQRQLLAALCMHWKKTCIQFFLKAMSTFFTWKAILYLFQMQK